MTDRGSENSKIFLAKGLLYRILEEQSKPIGAPIKVSDFYSKSTLKFSEEKFKRNEVRRILDKARVKNVIATALLKEQSISTNELARMLEKEGIHTVFRKSAEGLLYGIT